MLRWERKIVDFIERNLHVFSILLLTFILWYMRKGVYYHEVFDLEATLVASNEGFYHTVGYELLLSLLLKLPKRPVLAIKIIVALFDFLVALLATWICYDCSREKEGNVLPIICYGVFVISPLIIAYGSVWNHLDCVGMFLVLLAYRLRKYSLNVIADMLVGLAMSLFGVYLFVGIIYVFVVKGKDRIKSLLAIVGMVLVISFTGAITLERTGVEILVSYFNFLIKNPYSGEAIRNVWEFLPTLVLRCGYVIGLCAVLHCFVGKKKRVLGAIVHVVLTCFVGLFLQYGYWWL